MKCVEYTVHRTRPSSFFSLRTPSFPDDDMHCSPSAQFSNAGVLWLASHSALSLWLWIGAWSCSCRLLQSVLSSGLRHRHLSSTLPSLNPPRPFPVSDSCTEPFSQLPRTERGELFLSPLSSLPLVSTGHWLLSKHWSFSSPCLILSYSGPFEPFCALAQDDLSTHKSELCLRLDHSLFYS